MTRFQKEIVETILKEIRIQHIEEPNATKVALSADLYILLVGYTVEHDEYMKSGPQVLDTICDLKINIIDNANLFLEVRY